MANEKFWKDGKRTPEYTESLVHQLRMWIHGVSIHNAFSDECCPDFSCCRPELLNDRAKRERVGFAELAELTAVQ